MSRIVLLLPPLPELRVAQATLLERCLARGDRLASIEAGGLPALQRYFIAQPPVLAAAPLTRMLDAGDAADGAWVRADPAFVRADIAAGRMLACGELGLSLDEAQELARTLKPLFGDFGFQFTAPHPARWYLSLPRETRLPRLSPPEDALGADLNEHLPSGDGAARWRHLLNEAQVLLHNHPANAARAERGAVPVNSVWFWGGGALPDSIRPQVRAVATDDPIALGLSRAAKVVVVDHRLGVLGGAGDVLIDLRGKDGLEIERAWIEPVLASLRRGEIGVLELSSVDGRAFSYRHAHRWRWWRRALQSA